jgi:hypothetical protein
MLEYHRSAGPGIALASAARDGGATPSGLNLAAGLGHYLYRDAITQRSLKSAAMDNSSLPAADHTTHAKVIALSLAASLTAGLVGMMAHSHSVDTNVRVQAAGPVLKAGKQVAVSHSGMTVIR